jgi:Domain of unknown function (DUF3291)
VSTHRFVILVPSKWETAFPGEWMMTFVSLTRLRIRSIRFLPLFGFHTLRSLRQARKAAGFRGGALLPDRSWTFWTMTAWDSEESMRAYRNSGPHKIVMPRLLHWCDEASVAHWVQAETELPSWTEADKRMRESGRASKVLHPSPQHASLSYRTPRTTAGGPIRPSSSKRK